MTEFIPYLFFNGEAAEAMDYYSQIFNAEHLALIRYGDMYQEGMPISEEDKERVMHGSLQIDGKRILFTDNVANEPKELDVSIAIISSDANQLQEYYQALAPDAKEVLVEFQVTDWSPGYGMLVDKYGVKWQLNVEPA